MKHNTKKYGKRRSSRIHRRGHRMMKGGYFYPNTPYIPGTYTDSANAIGGPQYERGTVGDFGPLMSKFDTSPDYSTSNALDSNNQNSYMIAAAKSGAAGMQNGGARKKNYQNQYQNQNQNQFQQQNNRQYQYQNQNQNQQQNQRGGVWNQMIGEAVAPLVLLGLQQYYGPRSKTNKGNKGKRTRRYRK